MDDEGDGPEWLWKLSDPLDEIKVALKRIAYVMESKVAEANPEQYARCGDCGFLLVPAGEEQCPVCHSREPHARYMIAPEKPDTK